MTLGDIKKSNKRIVVWVVLNKATDGMYLPIDRDIFIKRMSSDGWDDDTDLVCVEGDSTIRFD